MADKEEDLIDVGDENESAVEIILEDDDKNPNIIDQLDAASDGDEQDEDDDKKDKEDINNRTPAQKLSAFLDLNPDVSEYRSKDIKDRINKLTYEKNEAERQMQAATDYAQGVQTENVTLKTKQQHQDGVFINEHKARLEAQLETAKGQYRDAHEAGDPSLMADANALLGRTSAELSQAEQTEGRFSRFVRENPTPESTVQPWRPEPAAAPRPEPDAKAAAWADRNKWFGENENMTNAALTIHKTLVTQDGYLPTGEGYYAELDSRMRKNFPQQFEVANPPEISGQQVVTPSNSAISAPKQRRKGRVHLSPSQVAIAKKLGVPLEEYAKYV